MWSKEIKTGIKSFQADLKSGIIEYDFACIKDTMEERISELLPKNAVIRRNLNDEPKIDELKPFSKMTISMLILNKDFITPDVENMQYTYEGNIHVILFAEIKLNDIENQIYSARFFYERWSSGHKYATIVLFCMNKEFKPLINKLEKHYSVIWNSNKKLTLLLMSASRIQEVRG